MNINEIKWFQSIEVEQGIHTISAKETAKLTKRGQSYFKGVDFKNKSVIDIGAAEGFFSFAAKSRGAGRVLATDSFLWSDEWAKSETGGLKYGGTKKGFDFARAKLGLTAVEDKFIDVFDINPGSTGMFDIVLFLGVFYHLRHPFLGLEKAASVAKETLIVETALDAVWQTRPMMVFYPGSEMAGDPTNWWGPNVPLMLAFFKDLGFKKIEWRKDPVWKKRAHFVAHR